MKSQFFPRKPTIHSGAIESALCSICRRRVSLEESKTDEHGLAVHENCYLQKVGLRHRNRKSLSGRRHGLALVHSRTHRRTTDRRTKKGVTL
jgi:hypothetical protein